MTYRIYDGYTMSYQDEPSEEHPSMKGVGQYDSRGQPVYECDILQRDKARGVVEWDPLTLRFLLRFGTELVPLTEASVFTVAGNAFEHGELI